MRKMLLRSVMMIDSVILDKKNCTGCCACESICSIPSIAMDSDEEGFWYPKVNYASCIQCRKCIDVCPIINKKTVVNEVAAYACMNKDESVRHESSSGGLFTLIASQVIRDGGVVFGAGFNINFEVEHGYVETIDELEKFRGSKYVQSRIGTTYRQAGELLESGRTVLFTGTPCQVGGLKAYLGKPYDKLFCADIICHGVPSPKLWQKYVSYRESIAGAPARAIFFRAKNEGWRRFSVSFFFGNDTEYRQKLDNDLYMRAFLQDVCLRPSCYDCAFKTLHRESDMTLADFWGIESVLPEMDDDNGTSLIFINNAKSETMLEQIKDKMVYKRVDIDQAVAFNSSAIKSVGYNQKRGGFFEELESLSFDQLVGKYCGNSLYIKLKNRIKSLVRKTLA